jgi:hypothetical protein
LLPDLLLQCSHPVFVDLVAGVVVLAFYLSCLIKQPKKDATVRFGLMILASIAKLVLTLLPKPIASRAKSTR